MITKYRLHRDKWADDFTLGELFRDDSFLGYTVEDADRNLEDGGDKVYGKSAIPRGRYALTISRSARFGKDMPEVHDVPGFTGVRIHGGNTAADTLGCPLLGSERTSNGVRNCAAINAHLIELLRADLADGEAWLTVE